MKKPVKFVTFEEFSKFADAVDSDGPGAAPSELSPVALEVLIEAATSAAAKATLEKAHSEKMIPAPTYYPEGPFADDLA